MFATVQSKSTTDFSSQNLNLDAIVAASWIAQPGSENVEESVETWDSYTSTISEAIVDALKARTIAIQNYVKVQALADTWERQLQEALKNSCSDLIRKALLGRHACKDRVHYLKTLIEKHSVQISTLESQLAFWQNQLAS